MNQTDGGIRPINIKSSVEVTQAEELADIAIKASESGKRISGISIAEPRLENLRLHGREDEIKFLNTKLRELNDGRTDNGATDVTTKKRPELLLVKGESGTGKTALVMQGLRNPADEMGMVFAGGKFDLNRTALPLSAFFDAMSSLTKYLIVNDRVEQIKFKIILEFEEDERILLARAMTGCEDLFPIEEISPHARDSLALGGKEAAMRLQFAIRRLLKVICSNLKGAVLFIDDLQWSDASTLDLIRSVCLDTEIESLLFVGAYRKEGVPDSHPLAIHIRELREQRGVAITTINVENLSPSNVTSLVANVLRMEGDENAVSTLAESVYKKTGGNAFYILIFLRYLYDDGLIQFNLGALEWRWDVNTISYIMVTQNVATVMINKLKRFQEEDQNVLMVASCFGASFSTSVVAMVVESLSLPNIGYTLDCDKTASLMRDSVAKFVKDGVWESDTESKDVCRFSHDEIQSAAFGLIPFGEKDSFRWKVGNALMKMSTPDLLEEYLFETVSLLNCAMSSMPDDERQALAKMNLRAGLKASKNAAFETAVAYFNSGRELLDYSWKVDHDTMLQLCSEEVNARFVSNEGLDTMNRLIYDVLSQPIPLRDKFKVTEVKVKSALAAGNLQESLDTALEFCRKLGLPTPENKPVSTFIILKEYYRTKRVLGNRDAEQIASLPELSDEQIIMGQEMMRHSTTACLLSQPTLLPILISIMIRSFVKFGISASSCDGFACFGLVLCGFFRELNKGREMTKAVELIFAKRDWKVIKPRTVFICETFVLHWTAPLQASFVPLLEGYRMGLYTGDIDSAGWCLVTRCHHLFYAARALEGLQKEINTCIDILSQLNLESHRLCVFPYLLTVKRLRGVCTKDSCMDFEDMLKIASATNNLANRGHAIFAQLELLVVFNEWESASELLAEAGNLRLSIPGHFVGVRFTALEALISFKMAQTSALLARIMWKRRGVKAFKLLQSWAKKGNVNVVHSLYLLSAELAVLKGDGKKAEERFKAAVMVAATSGLRQDKALAHNLAHEFYTSQGDKYWADYSHEQSQEAYSDWGANAKVDQKIVIS